MNKISDRELVRRCQRERPYETRSFEILVDRYKDRVFAKCLSMLRNREEAEDVAQDIFIRAFQGIGDFRDESAFSTWLYAITVNVCLNHIEKSKRRPDWWPTAVEIDPYAERIEDIELFSRVTRRLESEETAARIETVLGRLTADEQRIIRLRYFYERDHAAIAEELNIGLSAVKMRLKRARESFRVAYETLGGTL